MAMLPANVSGCSMKMPIASPIAPPVSRVAALEFIDVPLDRYETVLALHALNLLVPQ